MNITIKCSEDQLYIIEEHLFTGVQLIMLPTERIMVYEHCKNKFPTKRILSANLNLEDAEWEIELGERDEAAKEKETDPPC
jgi:hypothetical protein